MTATAKVHAAHLRPPALDAVESSPRQGEEDSNPPPTPLTDRQAISRAARVTV
jgi:hypothetical protein